MSNQLTIHIVNSVPYSNLNRDDSGTPKRIILGGALRAVHSAQAIKRGIRVAYQQATKDIAIRSGNLVQVVTDRVQELNPTVEESTVAEAFKGVVKYLTGAEKDASLFLSGEEIEAISQAIAAGNGTTAMVDPKKLDTKEKAEHVGKVEMSTGDETVLIIDHEKTGSLAIAAFGRMFANSDANTTEAALAVSPGVTTHAAQLSTDYYTTVDDLGVSSGASFLGVNQFTSGVFYRTITIDKDQLRRSWSGFDSENAAEYLHALVESVLFGMPQGKKNSTAPYTMPALILAEEQKHRVAFDIDTPVRAAEDGGFVTPTLKELATQSEIARRFDPDNFKGLRVVSGTAADLENVFSKDTIATKDELVESITAWIVSE